MARTRRTTAAEPARAQHLELSEKQLKALNSPADIVICGGGNGGGKSHTIRVLPLLPEYLGANGCRTVLFAESNTKLEQADGMVDECRKLYGSLHPDGLGGYRQTPKKRWTFPTGATIDLSFVGEPGQWDGLQAAIVGIDQVEQITEDQFESVAGRNRTMAAVRPRVIATANPPIEGKEHWLTRLLEAGGWIDGEGWAVPEMDGRVRWFVRTAREYMFADDPEELLPHCRKGSDGLPVRPRSITFVQMLVKDHPDAEFRRQYERTMSGYSEIEQLRRWDGNWHATEEAGKYFRKEFFWPPIEYDPGLYRSNIRKVRAWDCAWSESDGADWTPGLRMEQGADGFVVCVDLLRFRGSQAHVERAIKAVAELDGRDVEIRLPKDAGLAGFAQSALARWLAARGYTVTLTADRGDKITRSKPYQGRCERREVRLARCHLSAGVAEMLTKPFQSFDAEGKEITIKGLDISNVSTINEWHSSFLLDHVQFGRNTIKKKKIKKDVVDAAVGGNEVLTMESSDPADVDEEQIKAEFVRAQRELGGGAHRGPSAGFGYGRGGGSKWL